MFEGLFDKEGMVEETIQDCLKTISEELNCSPKGMFITIEAVNDEFAPVFKIYQKQVQAAPKYIRDISIKEILGDEEQEEG